MKHRYCTFFVLLCTAATAIAQDTASPANADTSGTTVVGERDSAMGLNFLPWKDENAANPLQPPALYDVAPAPVDSASLRRAAAYRDETARYRRDHTRNP